MVNRSFQLIISVIILTLSIINSANAKSKLEIINFKSNVFNNDRTLRILLPEGYDPNRKAPYKVLYMNDGQNLFSARQSMTGHEWKMDEISEELIRSEKIESIVIVGIDTPSYADRGNEYLPWPDEYLKPYIAKPNGQLYPAFLEQEVIPRIEKKYNVGKTASRRALGGSSYGGLMTLYTALETKNVFNLYLIESPSLYVADGAIFNLLKNKKITADKLYIGIGTHEGLKSCDQEANMDAVNDMKSVVDLMKGSFKIYDIVEECGLHSENDWSRRLPAALTDLFGS
ncbi:MAG: alpha/beta hydrolase [Kordiimonadaceae bacterium]|nr:alpha/beta hydrolase [Kordiimonadaceae bacterium]